MNKKNLPKLNVNSILVIIFCLLVMIMGLSLNDSYSVTTPSKSTNYGIKVDANGTMKINNNYFKAMGMNGFGFLLYELNLKMNSNLSMNPPGYKAGDYEKYFKLMNQYKIPFARITFGGWTDLAYRVFDKSSNHAEYFECADKIVKAAEKYNIGIIVDFFWYSPTVQYHNGEYLIEIANPNSKSIKYEETFIKAIIQRYKSSPAIWGYEIGNEYNLDADLMEKKYHYAINGSDNVRNHITTDEISRYYSIISEKIYKEDSTRFITTGDSVLLDNVATLYESTKGINYENHRSWENFPEYARYTGETPYKEMIKRFNANNKVSVISMHLYKPSTTMRGYINIYQDVAKELKKPIYFGEFGGPYTEIDARYKFESEVSTIKESDVQLSSPWLSDDSGRFMTYTLGGNMFYVDSLKDYFLETIKDYNSTYQKVIDDAWISWKKAVKVNVSNATYKLTKTNNYESEVKSNSVSNYYITGDKVKIEFTPNSGYTIKSYTVKTTSGTNITVSGNQFVMPNDDVVITANVEKVVVPTQALIVGNGDVNSDGKITTIDYILIRKHILGISLLKGNSLLKADISKDGKITTNDYILVRKAIISGNTTPT